MKHLDINLELDHVRQPPSGGCVLKHLKKYNTMILCSQPPSGGCVLKLLPIDRGLPLLSQPPSGGCVLKLLPIDRGLPLLSQPPSGGCVLKLLDGFALKGFFHPAAFGRLCVETLRTSLHFLFADQPPSGGCVLKPSLNLKQYHYDHQPPSGGCVLKLLNIFAIQSFLNPAAFGRLCVETANRAISPNIAETSRLRAAVC